MNRKPSYDPPMPPIIGITTRPRTIATSGGQLGADTLQHTYRDSVVRGGGVPLPLSPVASDHVGLLLDRIDGLVLTGGGDVAPDAYGGTRIEAMYGIDEERDTFEFALTLGARERRMPVLAICRGLQVVNVALGGTLIEDIPSFNGSSHHAVRGEGVFSPHQQVTLEEGSLMARVVDSTHLRVNSIHHQAIRDVALGLRVVGRSADGIIEAVQSEDDGWPLLAVQWHPEYLGDAGDGASRALFSALASAAGGDPAG